jgi:hypothetical protein
MFPTTSGSQRKRRRRRGFTMIEVVTTTFLTVLLGMLLATAVATFARPSSEVEHRSRIALEANLVAEAMAQDLGGYLTDVNAGLGTPAQYAIDPASPWSYSSDNKTFLLHYTNPEAFVQYEMRGNQLVRTTVGILPSSVTVIAGHLVDFNAFPCDQYGNKSGSGDHARIEFTMAYYVDDPTLLRKGNVSGTYVLIAQRPSS